MTLLPLSLLILLDSILLHLSALSIEPIKFLDNLFIHASSFVRIRVLLYLSNYTQTANLIRLSLYFVFLFLTDRQSKTHQFFRLMRFACRILCYFRTQVIPFSFANNSA